VQRTWSPQSQFCCTSVVVTKLYRLHSASTWPPFRLCARSVALKLHPPPSQTSGQLIFSIQMAERLACPKTPHATELRHRCTPPRLPLHSGSQVSSLRRIKWCDQSAVEFSAKQRAPNPTPLSSQTGWRTHTSWFPCQHFATTDMQDIISPQPCHFASPQTWNGPPTSIISP
jgi:hypothetical protein